MTWFVGVPELIFCSECNKMIWKITTIKKEIDYWEKTFLGFYYYKKHNCKNIEVEP